MAWAAPASALSPESHRRLCTAPGVSTGSPARSSAWRATFQPAVLATGTAVLADADDAGVPENRYLYKVRLTR